MSIRAIFFDLDDTLCDTVGSQPARARFALARLASADPRFDLDALVADAVAAMDGQHSRRGIDHVLARLGLAGTALAAEIVETFRSCYAPIVPTPGARDTVRRLARRYRLGIISNDEERFQRGKLRHLGLDCFMEIVMCSDQAGARKPDPRIFTAALAAADLSPLEAVYVGDHPLLDIAAARGVGLWTVWFNPQGAPFPDDLPPPHAEVRALTDLPAALAALSAESEGSDAPDAEA
ncbi:MAG: HAD family hydrolase [Chloroflexota bacterium]|nr:HAD family hydrolase [Dehalococcoidia bacterium]MDW8254168.1 HAD family hydrolase [Chloroflexota bacterium]